METIQLITPGFKEKVFNYETEKDCKYQGAIPASIDIYTDWCGLCKMVVPESEELSNAYEGCLIVYKVNTDSKKELSPVLGILRIPTLRFVCVDGEPMMQPGAFPKHAFKNLIEEKLLLPVKAED
jgi:thioredoxin-like negative regulator of GroEL